MMPSHSAISLKDWDKAAVVGQGSYGVVYLGVPKNPDLGLVAIKACPLLNSFSLVQERAVLKNFIGCPEIIQSFGYDMDTREGHYYYNVIMEYATDGALSDLIRQRRKLPEREVREYLRMILRGLSRIHAKGFVHADLKPANILAFSDGEDNVKLKIADFGLARRFKEGKGHGRKMKFIGTPMYMSPESLTGEVKPALDIWSLGCVLVYMVSGREIWEECSWKEEFVSKLVNGTVKVPEELSEKGKDFLRRCLERNTRERWSADMLLEHPYLEEVEHKWLEGFTILQKVGALCRDLCRGCMVCIAARTKKARFLM